VKVASARGSRFAFARQRKVPPKLRVPAIYNFKQTISLHYRSLYNDILNELLNGTVLYIDETSANLRSETGYVWCITNGSSVYYFYRDSREGSFLIDMFKTFRGVLVSDFYTAYDRKQRCLVHLMRDFNEEIQNHPYDFELKSLGANFSKILRSLVTTIDKYGFKKRILPNIKRQPAAFAIGLHTANLIPLCRKAPAVNCKVP
jgi:hypothetical protein